MAIKWWLLLLCSHRLWNVCRTWWRSVSTCQARRTVSGLSVDVRRGSAAVCSGLPGHCRHLAWSGLKRTSRSRWKDLIIHWVGCIPPWTLLHTAVVQLHCARELRLRLRLLHRSSPLINERCYPCVVVIGHLADKPSHRQSAHGQVMPINNPTATVLCLRGYSSDNAMWLLHRMSCVEPFSSVYAYNMSASWLSSWFVSEMSSNPCWLLSCLLKSVSDS